VFDGSSRASTADGDDVPTRTEEQES
jgi:hypothetical protein